MKGTITVVWWMEAGVLSASEPVTPIILKLHARRFARPGKNAPSMRLSLSFSFFSKSTTVVSSSGLLLAAMTAGILRCKAEQGRGGVLRVMHDGV